MSSLSLLHEKVEKRQKSTWKTRSKCISNLMRQVKDCQSALNENPDGVIEALSTLKSNLLSSKVMKQINDSHKLMNHCISKLGKEIDEKFGEPSFNNDDFQENCDEDKVIEKLLWGNDSDTSATTTSEEPSTVDCKLPENLLEEAVFDHFGRRSRVDKVFDNAMEGKKAEKSESELLQILASESTLDEKKIFSLVNAHTLVKELETAANERRLEPLMKWAHQHRKTLELKNSDLIFRLAKIRFLEFAKHGRIEDAVSYARTHFNIEREEFSPQDNLQEPRLPPVAPTRRPPQAFGNSRGVKRQKLDRSRRVISSMGTYSSSAERDEDVEEEERETSSEREMHIEERGESESKDGIISSRNYGEDGLFLSREMLFQKIGDIGKLMTCLVYSPPLHSSQEAIDEAFAAAPLPYSQMLQSGGWNEIDQCIKRWIYRELGLNSQSPLEVSVRAGIQVRPTLKKYKELLAKKKTKVKSKESVPQRRQQMMRTSFTRDLGQSLFGRRVRSGIRGFRLIDNRSLPTASGTVESLAALRSGITMAFSPSAVSGSFTTAAAATTTAAAVTPISPLVPELVDEAVERGGNDEGENVALLPNSSNNSRSNEEIVPRSVLAAAASASARRRRSQAPPTLDRRAGAPLPPDYNIVAPIMDFRNMVPVEVDQKQRTADSNSLPEQEHSQDQLPIEIDLGKELQQHSVFVCPVLREESQVFNPPILLKCSHVLSLAAVHKLKRQSQKKDSDTLKCPYCKIEQSESETMPITF